MNVKRIFAGIAWLHRRRRAVNAWVVRGVSFYFGYRILHHEVYSVQSTDPLLVFVGLWLCGIAPTSFFDSLRRAGVNVGNAPAEHRPELGKGELESKHEHEEP